MSVKIGISPIAWQNDDLPDLTAEYTMGDGLKVMRDIGYVGVERGRRMPEETEPLRAFLCEYDMALCGGWCSGNLLVDDVATERQNISQQVAQFAGLNAPTIVYAECSNTVQGDIYTPVNNRPKLCRDAIKSYAEKLGELAKWTADQGVPLSYHPHMGTIIENQDDVDWLMEYAPPEVHLLYDTGHLLFGRAGIIETLKKWGDRILHVHYKDIRPEIVVDIRQNERSFLDGVMAGAFTVPGDGVIDFYEVTQELANISYAGWIVVEAEQDPAKAEPYGYSKIGYEHILACCKAANLEISE